MRLSSLKLAGFKSFADPTTLHFKANRTAVVGPNGCGKSNVIDAIRWVMGESSARQLRGGSMQDVIFTGTSKRKPVSVASVELRFENTYGKLGGAYNAYNELSVKRQVNRDGKSEYFLNGTRCRRRDITDIFLGTGLGPRSYAIIEQGMINRLVEAKPEEMRVFIEEAAGVSRYQARRRETLQHLEHTEQNLSRLADIAAELKNQLRTLKRQSEAAEQYQHLQQQMLTLKVEILSYQSLHSVQLQQQYTAQLTDLGEQFKQVRSELGEIEQQLEHSSQLFQNLIEQSSPLQQASQQSEALLAELRLQLQQQQRLQTEQQQRLEQAEQLHDELKQQRQLLDVQLEDAFAAQEQAQIDVLQAEMALSTDQAQMTTLAVDLSQRGERYQALKSQVEQLQQRQHNMQQQLQQLQKSVARLQQQKDTLTTQLEQIATQLQNATSNPDVAQHIDLPSREAELSTQLAQIETRQQQRDALQAQQQTFKQQQQTLHTQIQLLQGEQRNLQQLQAKQSVKVNIESQLLSHLQLSAAAVAHTALIEKFLGKWLAAQVVASADAWQADTARQLRLAVASNQSQSDALKSQALQALALQALPRLSEWIISPQHSLWANVWLCDTLAQAQSLQAQLQAGQSLLSLDGYHMGADWLVALDYDQDAQAAQAALSHHLRLQQIATELAALTPQAEQVGTRLSAINTTLQQTEQTLKNDQAQHQQAQRQLQQALEQQRVLEAKQQSSAQAFALQQQQLTAQFQQLDAQLEEDAMQRDDLEIDLHALQMKLDAILPDYQALAAAHAELSEQQHSATQRLTQRKMHYDTLQRELSQLQQQIELLQKDQSFVAQQWAQLQQQRSQAIAQLEPLESELPILQQRFDSQLEQTQALQQQWQSWQQQLNTVQQQQQQLTEQRQQLQQQDEQLREALENKRLAWQAAKSDLSHFEEQLAELGAQRLPEVNINLAQHQQQLAAVQQRFERMGAVNLAAAEEYQEVNARHEELSHQMQDLENTVLQLKDAMHSIDQETRKLFMNTFDLVNTQLQELFPKVFNGGEASLSLEDDWQSGVKLMARPPGKRNSSLALLSGGEKALTALALVFAIFRLNPAPFCVLDEVDAPLDDANVQRYANLVKELSEHVQFIYITHNKLAMTMATDLLGVTMPEAGTSKLVAVSLEQAEEFGMIMEAEHGT